MTKRKNTKAPNTSPAIIEKHLQMYRAMSTAVAACHGFDECKDIVDKSVAMAAYYERIKDTETVTMFYRVRMQAWRRLGELLLASVDLTDCESLAAKRRKIRAAFPDDPTVKGMPDNVILDVLKLMEISDADFEYAIKQDIRGSLKDFFNHTPAGEAAIEAARKQREQWERQNRRAERKEALQDALKENTAKLKRAHDVELQQAADDAMKEVGVTLERKYRVGMKSVVFLIKDQIHTIMRRAAFDHRTTMQDILRQGLRMWLNAHGYELPGQPGYRADTDDRPPV